jgi:3-hydroxybutyryl-CoA dehydrogenase
VIYASNTSSIAITEMAPREAPLHVRRDALLQPVPMMRLVEVIPAMQTGKSTVDLALAMAKKLDKTPSPARTPPGSS